MVNRLKKGDTVIVISGSDTGKKGKILEIFPDENRAIVEKVAVAKKHQRPTQKFPGGIIEKLKKINMSKVMLVCSRCNEPARVKAGKIKNGKSVRVCKKCEEIIDKE